MTDLVWRGHRLQRLDGDWSIRLAGMKIDAWQRRGMYCACICADGLPTCYCLDRDTHVEAIDGAAESMAAIVRARVGHWAAALEILED